MAATYELIASNTLTTTAASVTFSSIPNTYSDLVLMISARTSASQNRSGIALRFNGATTNVNMSGTWLEQEDNTVYSFRNDTVVQTNGNTTTSNVFGNAKIYFPNYTSSVSKSYASFFVIENNSATGNQIAAVSGLFQNTSALNEIKLISDFVSGSSFFLYGLKDS